MLRRARITTTSSSFNCNDALLAVLMVKGRAGRNMSDVMRVPGRQARLCQSERRRQALSVAWAVAWIVHYPAMVHRGAPKHRPQKRSLPRMNRITCVVVGLIVVA